RRSRWHCPRSVRDSAPWTAHAAAPRGPPRQWPQRAAPRCRSSHLPYPQPTENTVYATRCVCHTLFMSHTEPPVVEIAGLTKRYGTQPVLHGLDLVLGPGVHALLGPNGAGKTTLVNILTTLIPHEAGTVRVLGLDPRHDARRLRHLIST